MTKNPNNKLEAISQNKLFVFFKAVTYTRLKCKLSLPNYGNKSGHLIFTIGTS